jgi:PKD repeat protein
LKKKLLIGLVAIFLLVGILSGCVEEEPEPTPENNAPEAMFTAVIDGMMVNFTDESTDADGDDLTYLWDFDDDVGTSTDQNPSYTYTENGTYTVTLTVSDDEDSATWSEEIIVGNIAPTAGFTYIADNLTVTFTDTSSDPNEDNLTYLWDFGDGTTNDTQNPVYTYASNGTYNVTLTVTDPYGETDTTDIEEITVEEAATEE